MDETTIRLTYPEARPTLLIAVGSEVGNRGFRPAHYFKQFHMDYNEDANALAAENGFEDWVQMFNAKMSPYNFTWNLGSETDPYAPTLNTFVFVREDSFGNKYYERNRLLLQGRYRWQSTAIHRYPAPHPGRGPASPGPQGHRRRIQPLRLGHALELPDLSRERRSRRLSHRSGRIQPRQRILDHVQLHDAEPGTARDLLGYPLPSGDVGGHQSR